MVCCAVGFAVAVWVGSSDANAEAGWLVAGAGVGLGEGVSDGVALGLTAGGAGAT
ncbi:MULTISPECIES: hypothetical protein [unclassified Luteococcus]|uniref:hypothetical protein n=1 Tax=unclassified Luteococcus TaxID=2639923 RepID=UPI00313CE057